MKKTVFCILLLVLATIAAADESVQENELFSNPDVVISEPAANTAPVEEKKSIGFSGEITSAVADIINRTPPKDSLYSYIVGNIFLDVRMKQGLKAFANMETTYLSQSKTTDVALRELFFDFNIAHRVYFRTGKQVLQWGRCYFWNPTDLINVERKRFIQKIGYREGAYGLKMHIPLGTKMNIYSFFDTGNAPEAKDSGGALKFEFLTGGTEMAFSGWVKGGYIPVFGYDFSTRIKDFDVVGELSMARGNNNRIMREDQGVLSIERQDHDLTTRASIGATQRYRLGNFNDRVAVTGELYYNQRGYIENIFADTTEYVFNPSTGTMGAPTSGTKKDFLLGHNLYDQHSFSRYYAALFTSGSRFILTDMVLQLNYIRNLSDSSGIISTGVNYTNINDFSVGFLANYYLGKPNREYTFPGQKTSFQLTFGITF